MTQKIRAFEGNDETLKDNRSSGCAPPSLADKDFAHDQVDSHVPSQSSGLMVNVDGVDSVTLLQFTLADMRHKSNSDSKQTRVTANPV